jgi:DNA polymerase III sliding clamp (beta) subunit (PCNA family)
MKFKIPVSDLQYAMGTVKDVAPTSGPLAETAGVKIVAEGDRAVFYAFNPEMMARAVVKIIPEADGEVVVDPSALYSAVSHFKPAKEEGGVGTSDVSVLLAPRTKKLQIAARTKYASGVSTPHKRVFPLKTAGGFPDLPTKGKVKNTFDLPGDLVMGGIDSVGYAVSSDQNQFMFTGILLQLEEGRLTLFATNGICLAEYSTPLEYSGETLRVIIPGSFAQKVAKSFFDDDTLSCALTKNMLYLRTPNLAIGGTLIGDEYPDYKEVLPKPTVFAEVDKHVFLDNLLSLSYEASLIDDNRVSIVIEDGEVFLRCGQSENKGIPAKMSKSMQFDCNLKLLAGSVKNIFGNTLKIGFAGKDRPLTFSSADGPTGGPELTCVLVPLTT